MSGNTIDEIDAPYLCTWKDVCIGKQTTTLRANINEKTLSPELMFAEWSEKYNVDYSS